MRRGADRRRSLLAVGQEVALEATEEALRVSAGFREAMRAVGARDTDFGWPLLWKAAALEAVAVRGANQEGVKKQQE